jgi:hypothetical protein
MEKNLTNFDEHYPHAFRIHHASPYGECMELCSIIHRGDDINQLLIYLLCIHYDNICARAVLSCVDDGTTIHINNYYTDRNSTKTQHLRVQDMLCKLFPNHQTTIDCTIPDAISKKTFLKMLRWFNHEAPDTVANYYNITSFKNYMPMHDHPWIVQHEKYTYTKIWQRSYSMRKQQYGSAAAIKLQAYWRKYLLRRQLPLAMNKLRAMHELIYYPGIGVEYFKAHDRFMRIY